MACHPAVAVRLPVAVVIFALAFLALPGLTAAQHKADLESSPRWVREGTFAAVEASAYALPLNDPGLTRITADLLALGRCSDRVSLWGKTLSKRYVPDTRTENPWKFHLIWTKVVRRTIDADRVYSTVRCGLHPKAFAGAASGLSVEDRTALEALTRPAIQGAVQVAANGEEAVREAFYHLVLRRGFDFSQASLEYSMPGYDESPSLFWRLELNATIDGNEDDVSFSVQPHPHGFMATAIIVKPRPDVYPIQLRCGVDLRLLHNIKLSPTREVSRPQPSEEVPQDRIEMTAACKIGRGENTILWEARDQRTFELDHPDYQRWRDLLSLQPMFEDEQ